MHTPPRITFKKEFSAGCQPRHPVKIPITTWKSLSPPRGLQLDPSCQARCPVKTSYEMEILTCSICSPTFNDALTSGTSLFLFLLYSIQRKNQHKYTFFYDKLLPSNRWPLPGTSHPDTRAHFLCSSVPGYVILTERGLSLHTSFTGSAIPLPCLQKDLLPLCLCIIRIHGKITFHQGGRFPELSQTLIGYDLIEF